MAKKKRASYMTPGEQVAGTVLFVVYLAVLPLAARPIFTLAERLLDTSFSAAQRSIIVYYLLFAVSVVIFHSFLARTCHTLTENLGGAVRTLGVGLVALYGLNELVYRLTYHLAGNRTNLNDTSVFAQLDTAPHMTALIVVFLAPFVEEVLFRGLVFGCLKAKSRAAAYLISCALFALLHVWQFAVGGGDLTYLVLMVQYLVPGAVLAWAYERTGTLWTSIALHAAANALSLWAAM
ncbi:CPBP family intramembrane glutamic endopeptidase [uncultured Oscillibacter sp.]|uniref:CPBP family intramembrane glutamic endopeptidase n=1 Tax=uncultured Oscillibacter sp. TaxID=876091 RepID=UPI0025E2B0C1|nr:CPBP family intramembrane glutamic endopeptidase [uncultured Oscillibacter sp.]